MIELHFPDIAPPGEPLAPSALDWLPSPEAVADAIEAACQGGQPTGLMEALEGSGGPALDMATTTLSSRAALLGMERGQGFTHHELRLRVPMPPALEPEVTIWDEGTVPVWHDGVLAEPKYFSFFQDTPLPVFNPNHRRKWRAHEMLHAAQGFYWAPEMTRFAFYLSARLNELLPVIHWYGLDEAYRPRCPEHDGELLRRDFCPACERAAVPWWETEEDWRRARRERAVAWIASAWEHLDDEWRACRLELETGRLHPRPRVGLDASSDSVGYMRGHWNRVTAWSFGAWVEMFLTPGIDHHSTIEGALLRAQEAAVRLVSGALRVDPALIAARRARRALQDMGYRGLLALEWLGEGSVAAQRAEAALMPALEMAGALCADLWEGHGMEVLPEAVAAWHQGVEEAGQWLPEPVRDALPGLGYIWRGAEALGLDRASQARPASRQVAEGLRSALPLATEAMRDADLLKVAHDHAATCDPVGRGLLAGRAAAWLQTREHPQAALAMAEATLAALPRKDEEADLFGALPDDHGDLCSGQGQLRLHGTLRRLSATPEVAQRLLGDPSAGELAAVVVEGELRVMVLDEPLARALDAAASGQPPADWVPRQAPEVLDALLENRFLIWLPQPR